MKLVSLVKIPLILILSGCTTQFININLVYQSKNQFAPSESENRPPIAIQRPFIENLLLNAEARVKTDVSDAVIVGVRNLKAVVGTQTDYCYTEDNIGDWIAGALGVELKAIGYPVQFINNSKATQGNGVLIHINKVFSTLQYHPGVLRGPGLFTCRGVIDIDFVLLQNGTVIEKFNINNEGDFPEYAGQFSYDPANTNCNSIALRDTLSQIMKQAVPVIVKTVEEQR